jgi:hypothetical protein
VPVVRRHGSFAPAGERIAALPELWSCECHRRRPRQGRSPRRNRTKRITCSQWCVRPGSEQAAPSPARSGVRIVASEEKEPELTAFSP